jgi:hypothetical protein
MTKPSDCTEVMSRSQCEAFFAAAHSASESQGEVFSPEECMQNPTPQCQEQLQAVFEAAAAAEK